MHTDAVLSAAMEAPRQTDGPRQDAIHSCHIQYSINSTQGRDSRFQTRRDMLVSHTVQYDTRPQTDGLRHDAMYSCHTQYSTTVQYSRPSNHRVIQKMTATAYIVETCTPVAGATYRSRTGAQDSNNRRGGGRHSQKQITVQYY